MQLVANNTISTHILRFIKNKKYLRYEENIVVLFFSSNFGVGKLPELLLCVFDR
jgi:hypothetical protein